MVNRVFVPHLLSLVDDKVPNIRFNVSKSFLGFYPNLNSANKEKICQALEKMAT